MLARVVGTTKRDDARIFRRRHRQAGPRRDLQARCIGECGHIACRKRYGFTRALRIDQEGGKHAGHAGQFQRRPGLRFPAEREGLERTLERVLHVERGIGDGKGRRQIEGLCPAHQHRLARRRRFALVGQLQRGRTRGGDQHRLARHFAKGGFDGLQQRCAFDRQRPAMAQRIDGLRSAARRRACAQSANSVTSGTWSDGFSQSRAYSWTEWPTACFASSGLAHIWSSRRPRSFVFQSFER